MSTQNNIDELQSQLEKTILILKKQKASRDKYKQTEKGKEALKRAKKRYVNKSKKEFF
jgi:predicted transcriptional regulator